MAMTRREFVVTAGAAALSACAGAGAAGAGAGDVPASAALLKIICPMSFSSTTADCVCLIMSPGLRSLSSEPGSMPTYWSPSRPEVRICAEESSGNWMLGLISIVTTPW